MVVTPDLLFPFIIFFTVKLLCNTHPSTFTIHIAFLQILHPNPYVFKLARNHSLVTQESLWVKVPMFDLGLTKKTVYLVYTWAKCWKSCLIIEYMHYTPSTTTAALLHIVASRICAKLAPQRQPLGAFSSSHILWSSRCSISLLITPNLLWTTYNSLECIFFSRIYRFNHLNTLNTTSKVN